MGVVCLNKSGYGLLPLAILVQCCLFIFFQGNMAQHLIAVYFQQREDRHENNTYVKLCHICSFDDNASMQ